MVDSLRFEKMKLSSSDEDKDEKEDVSSSLIIKSDGIFNFDKLKEALTDKSSWWFSLKEKERYEWFIDCYRLRVDDDCVWGGGNLHGLYEPDPFDGQNVTVLKDFLIYMKLAVRKEVITISECFSFPDCLEKAASLLPYAFENSDAIEKWGGGELLMTRPSLRSTAELVYGTTCMDDLYRNKKDWYLYNLIEHAVEKGVEKKFHHSCKELFKDVGGFEIWHNLFKSLRFYP